MRQKKKRKTFYRPSDSALSPASPETKIEAVNSKTANIKVQPQLTYLLSKNDSKPKMSTEF